MSFSNELAVAETFATKVRRHQTCEILEFFQWTADVDFVILVQEYRKKSLRATSVLDGLRSEEDFL